MTFSLNPSSGFPLPPNQFQIHLHCSHSPISSDLAFFLSCFLSLPSLVSSHISFSFVPWVLPSSRQFFTPAVLTPEIHCSQIFTCHIVRKGQFTCLPWPPKGDFTRTPHSLTHDSFFLSLILPPSEIILFINFIFESCFLVVGCSLQESKDSLCFAHLNLTTRTTASSQHFIATKKLPRYLSQNSSR